MWFVNVIVAIISLLICHCRPIKAVNTNQTDELLTRNFNEDQVNSRIENYKNKISSLIYNPKIIKNSVKINFVQQVSNIPKNCSAHNVSIMFSIKIKK